MTNPQKNSHTERSDILEGIGMLCRMFWGPEEAFCRELKRGDVMLRLETLCRACGTGARGDLARLGKAIHASGEGEADRLCGRLEEAYVRLFVSHHGGITAPLYQSCYEGSGAALMGRAALDMRRRLERRGLDLCDSLHEPPDHLSIELEYLYFLLEKGWRENDESLLREAAEFSSAVMLPWLREFNRRLAAETDCRFYPLAASLLLHVLSELSARLAPQNGPPK